MIAVIPQHDLERDLDIAQQPVRREHEVDLFVGGPPV
jgi:hypothetical protein